MTHRMCEVNSIDNGDDNFLQLLINNYIARYNVDVDKALEAAEDMSPERAHNMKHMLTEGQSLSTTSFRIWCSILSIDWSVLVDGHFDDEPVEEATEPVAEVDGDTGELVASDTDGDYRIPKKVQFIDISNNLPLTVIAETARRNLDEQNKITIPHPAVIPTIAYAMVAESFEYLTEKAYKEDRDAAVYIPGFRLEVKKNGDSYVPAIKATQDINDLIANAVKRLQEQVPTEGEENKNQEE